MTRTRIALRIMASTGALDAARGVADLESAGLDMAWVAEAYGFDAVSIMGYLAATTERLEIGSGVLPIFSRPPAVLAQTAAGLDHISEGRAVLGLGASNPQVVEGWYGVPYDAPLARTRQIIEICRQVWRREVLESDGRYVIPLPRDVGRGLGKPLKIIPQLVRPDIPIYLAALGPRNVELTAELAEGWMPMLYLPERAERAWGGALRAGRARRSASRPPLEIVAGGVLSISEPADEAALSVARTQVALYLGGMGARTENYYADLARRYGFGDAVEAVAGLYAAGERRAAAAVVPDELVRGTNLIGPRGFVEERVAAMREAGVSIIEVRGPGRPLLPSEIEDLRAIVDAG